MPSQLRWSELAEDHLSAGLSGGNRSGAGRVVAEEPLKSAQSGVRAPFPDSPVSFLKAYTAVSSGRYLGGRGAPGVKSPFPILRSETGHNQIIRK
jgi:hypothetical protein